VNRRLAHVPLGWRPTILEVRVRRYQCTGCGHVWRQDTGQAAQSRSKLSRHAVLWALKSVVVDRLSIARIAANLGTSWHTVNDAVLAAGRQLLIDDPTRLDGVHVIGVDEHAWRHTRRGNKYVTVIIDLTPVREGTGPARLLDMVEGRSKAVFKEWLEAQTPLFRNGIEVVAMDGFTGFKTAASEELPDAVAVMDPFHVVALAGDALDRCRQRVQQNTRGHRGRVGDPLYGIRRVLRTGADLLTDRQQTRLDLVFADHRHDEVATTWAVYQHIIAAYRDDDPRTGKAALTTTIAKISKSVPAELAELVTLGRTLKRRAADVLAYFDRPRTSNGPTEAINGRLEHLRGTALGFRNLTNYIARSLLDTGGFRPRIHPLLR
jgi:transposase